MAEMETTMGVKLDVETRGRLKALGQARDRSAHWLAVAAIKRYLDEEEEFERQKHEDTERWEEYVQSGNAIPQEKVLSWMKQMIAQGKRIEWQE